MAKGSGLSIDSDPIGFFIHKTPSVLNSFQDDSNNQNNKNIKKQYYQNPNSMDPPPPPPHTIQFPVNLNCTSPAPSTDDKRKVIDEMDFFRDNRTRDFEAASDDRSIAHDHRDLNGQMEMELKVNTGLNLLTTNTSSDQSMVLDDGVSTDAEDKKAKNKLTVLQAEFQQVKVENQRLKQSLSQVTSNYNALQMHIFSFMQNRKAENEIIKSPAEVDDHERAVVPRQFMDLGLASNNGGDAAVDEPSSSSEERRSGSAGNNIVNGKINGHNREDSPDPDQSCQGWVPNKVHRTTSSHHDQSAKENDQTEATMRKARVSVRARSEAPMIADGCQWRKYGQKMAKGNPCPRAYYRCTMAAGCPVRKQVQRCAEDQTILVTTYEGNHNHPLPPTAMAMASTTSSAARMLLSGSMPSADSIMNPNFLARSMLPCSSSMATISASAPFPTVTLDLTQSPNPLHLQKPQQISPFHVALPNSNPPSQGLLPHIFSQAQALYNNTNNQSKFSGLQVSNIAAAQENVGVPAVGHNGQQLQMPPLGQKGSLTDNITAAIAADPNFTAALAAAIKSIISGAHQSNVSNATTTTTTNNNSNENENGNGEPTTSNSK